MSIGDVVVVLYLIIINFVASIFQGVCGFGDIVALQVLWEIGISIAPHTFRSTALGEDGVRVITLLSYVRSFFMQLTFTALLFYEEWKVNRRRKEEGLPPRPSHFNWLFMLSMMLPMVIGTSIGVETLEKFNADALRIILGCSCFFFALSLLSLHMTRQLETRRIHDVINEDLLLMRTSQLVQRHEEQVELEANRRRRKRRQRRQHRLRRLRAQRQAQMQMQMQMLAQEQSGAATSERAAEESLGGSAGSADVRVHAVPPHLHLCSPTAAAAAAAAAASGSGTPSPPVTSQVTPAEHSTLVAAADAELAASHGSSGSLTITDPAALLAGGLALDTAASPAGLDGDPLSFSPLTPLSSPALQPTDAGPASALGGQDGGHGATAWGRSPSASTTQSPAARSLGTGTARTTPRLTPRVAPGSRTVELGVYSSSSVLPASVGTELERFIRTRLEELSASDGTATPQQAVAALTLQAIRDIDEDSQRFVTTNRRRRTCGSTVDSEERSIGVRPLPTTAAGGAGSGGQRETGESNSQTDGGEQPAATAADDNGIDGNRAQSEEEEDEDEDETAPVTPTANLQSSFALMGNRSFRGMTSEINVALREVQQHQLEALRRGDTATKKKRRKIRFVRMDGAVVAGAISSSFVAGVLASYTGVGMPAQMIFVLALNISGALFKINYAASNVLPATLRFAMGLAEGRFPDGCFPFYFAAMAGGFVGLLVGVMLGQRTATTGFFMSVIISLLLSSLAMLTTRAYILLPAFALAVAALVYVLRHEQRHPEHVLPPPPPNTPTTAREVAAFEDYWDSCTAYMDRLVELHSSFGSDFSLEVRDLSATARSRPVVALPDASQPASPSDQSTPLQRQATATPALPHSASRQSLPDGDVIIAHAPSRTAAVVAATRERRMVATLPTAALQREGARRVANEDEDELAVGPEPPISIVPAAKEKSRWM